MKPVRHFKLKAALAALSPMFTAAAAQPDTPAWVRIACVVAAAGCGGLFAYLLKPEEQDPAQGADGGQK